jgi:hypothetical protein
MRVIMNVNKKPKNVKVGDILVFSDTPYMIIRRRNSQKFDLMDLSGDGYWTGDLDWSCVLNYAEQADVHYSQDEHILELKQRQ